MFFQILQIIIIGIDTLILYCIESLWLYLLFNVSHFWKRSRVLHFVLCASCHARNRLFCSWYDISDWRQRHDTSTYRRRTNGFWHTFGMRESFKWPIRDSFVWGRFVTTGKASGKRSRASSMVIHLDEYWENAINIFTSIFIFIKNLSYFVVIIHYQ